MNPIVQFFQNAWTNFNKMEPAKKMSMAIVVLVTILGIVGVVYYTGQIDYRVLFSNLSSDDASNIIAKLQEKKIPYQISASGSTISVPSDKVAETRLEMAGSGLPQGGGVGFEIFDKKMMGATEFEQQLNYRRALQGELARTISSLDEIQSTRVHIVIPKESLFVEQQKKPTASVAVRLKSGRTLRQPQIEGIAHLVASSVEGLNPDDVMVIDSQGNILSKNQSGSKLANLSTSQIEYQRNIEKEMAGQIKSMLENVVGPGKAVVRVAADLDFRVTEKTEESYDPEFQVVRSTQKQAEKSTSPAAGTGGNTQQEKTDELINYEINKVVSKTIMPVGEIKKLSIAVLVDGIYTKDQKGTEAYQPREKKDLDTLEEVVRKSAGFNQTRGDQVTVTSMPFQKDAEQGASNWQEKVASVTMTLSPIIKYAAIIGAMLLIFMFVLKPLVRSLATAPVYHETEARSLPAGMTTAAIYGTAEPKAAELSMAPQAMPAEDKAVTEADFVKQLAVADSKKFADLLRSWL
jgi:flagellar M-ring protein FliF